MNQDGVKDIPPQLTGILVSSADTLSGAVRFVGTRVPVQALLDTLMCDHSIEFFLEGFPGVTRVQAEAVLRFEQNHVRELFGLELAS